MTALPFVLTNAGRQAIVDAVAGGTHAVVISQAGVTASAIVAAPTITSLPGEIKRISTVSGTAVDAFTVHLTVRDSSTDAYTVRSVALYLNDGTLFAVYSQPDPICQKADVTSFYMAADLTFAASDVAAITFGNTNFLNPPATTTTQGVAYLATISEALLGAVTNKIITPQAMAAVLANYVAATQLGIANGVATLGADGKLLISQRPPIDLIDVWPVANQAAMLALSATVGDFAVRADNGLVYVLQTAPATTLGNWLVLSTPAPVSSVCGKVGTVTLVASDVGAAPTTRTISGGGLVTGGGDLSANRTLTVAIASAAEALAGSDNTKALTAASLASILALIAAATPSTRTITGTGLATGGGSLAADRTIAVTAATAAEIAAGTRGDVAVTPAGLAGLPKSLTPNGYYMWPGGFMVQWVQYRGIITTEIPISVTFPIAFTSVVLPQSATAYLFASSAFRDLWAQILDPSLGGATVQLQSATSNDKRCDGFDLIVFGK
jgi:hypothetical protein